MESIPQPLPVQISANRKLGLRVRCANSGHVPAAIRGREFVSHGYLLKSSWLEPNSVLCAGFRVLLCWCFRLRELLSYGLSDRPRKRRWNRLAHLSYLR